jgi:2-amino-4-hydroxy-6-hydroxymethyldihydropteridine diphosphokinase
VINQVYLLLGSNLGDREKFLSGAIERMERALGKVMARSAVYTTKAWGKQDQNDFLNQAVCLQTPLPAETLMKEVLSIEKEMGRTREQKWDSRTIDIDILFFNAEVISTPNLTVPHPHLSERMFVLVPLNEIAGSYVHPVLRKSVKTMLQECGDKLEVRIAS